MTSVGHDLDEARAMLRDAFREMVLSYTQSGPVARPAEIPAGTVRSICRALGVPIPPNPR